MKPYTIIMRPSDEMIENFRRIYFEEYGEAMSAQEAYENLTSLVDLLRLFSKPAKKPKTDDDPNQ